MPENLAPISVNADVPTKKYVDDAVATRLTSGQADAAYVNIDGDTMSAGLDISAGGWVSDPAFRASTDIDPHWRYSVNVDGKITWGDGEYLGDTTLYRTAAGVLKTDGVLRVATGTNSGDAVNKGQMDAAIAASGGISQSEADTRYVNIDGDTLTGNLGINSAYSNFMVKSTSFAAVATLDSAAGYPVTLGIYSAGLARWIISKNTGEAGSNSGSDLLFSRYADNGSLIDTALSITRSTGVVRIYSGADLNNTKITSVAAGTAATDAVTKGQMEARTPPIIVLGPAAPVPGGTPSGTVIIRTVS